MSGSKHGGTRGKPKSPRTPKRAVDTAGVQPLDSTGAREPRGTITPPPAAAAWASASIASPADADPAPLRAGSALPEPPEWLASPQPSDHASYATYSDMEANVVPLAGPASPPAAMPPAPLQVDPGAAIRAAARLAQEAVMATEDAQSAAIAGTDALQAQALAATRVALAGAAVAVAGATKPAPNAEEPTQP